MRARGGVGFVALWLGVLFSPLAGCYADCGSGASYGGVPINMRGAETWMIDGQSVAVVSTYYLPTPKGMQFTIRAVWDRQPAGTDKATTEQAPTVAWSIMRHAYENGLHRRMQIKKVGSGEASASLIGVELVADPSGRATEFRAAEALDRVAARLAELAP